MQGLKMINHNDLGDFCFDIDNKVEQILNGNSNDLNKTDLENTYTNINEIRYFRSKIEENSKIYKDEDSKLALRMALMKVVTSLDTLKRYRNELGCGIVSNADINDLEITEHIFMILK